MPTSNQVIQQIQSILGYLVEVGLADDQNFPCVRNGGDGITLISFKNAEYASIALRNREYVEVYDELVSSRSFSAKLLDGAMIHIMYTFRDDVLQKHRLAFFSSPRLHAFATFPDSYLNDELYADVIANNIVPHPVRFDYDSSERDDDRFHHPRSHMTLGQYENCRIPVTAPLTPWRFIDFILRSFYHTAFIKYADRIPVDTGSFAESISVQEREIVHVTIPLTRV